MPRIISGFFLASFIPLDDVIITSFAKDVGIETSLTDISDTARQAVKPNIMVISILMLTILIPSVTLSYAVSKAGGKSVR